MSKKQSPVEIPRGAKGANIRETERVLRAARRANRRAFATLCALQREIKSTRALTPDESAERNRLEHLANLEGN